MKNYMGASAQRYLCPGSRVHLATRYNYDDSQNVRYDESQNVYHDDSQNVRYDDSQNVYHDDRQNMTVRMYIMIKVRMYILITDRMYIMMTDRMYIMTTCNCRPRWSCGTAVAVTSTRPAGPPCRETHTASSSSSIRTVSRRPNIWTASTRLLYRVR